MGRFLVVLIFIVIAALVAPEIMKRGVNQLPEKAQAAPQANVSKVRRGGHGTVILSAQRNGHFSTTARINNRFVDVMVDTGATAVALPYEEAARLGVRPGNYEFVVETHTANGVQYSAPVTLREVRIDTIKLYDVPALVAPRDTLATTLLGMTFLKRLKKVEMRAGELVMMQ